MNKKDRERIEALERANDVYLFIGDDAQRTAKDCIKALDKEIWRLKNTISGLVKAVGYELFYEPSKQGYRKIQKPKQ